MNIDHIHFYVDDAQAWRDWFVRILGFQAVWQQTTPHAQIEAVVSGGICFVLCSSRDDRSPVAQYLRLHPPGVAGIAFQVRQLEAVVEQAVGSGAKLLEPIQVQKRSRGCLKWAQILGWGNLVHTLVERTGTTPLLPIESATMPSRDDVVGTQLEMVNAIDHVVLNVDAGDLHRAVTWYETALGFQRQQQFAIQTDRSALCSQVLRHPHGTAQLPINEPASATSQIQEFLDFNHGAGIQHIALQTLDIVDAIAGLRQRGLDFLPVPLTYFEQLKQRPGFALSDAQWGAIAEQEILVDWRMDDPNAILWQAFTQPIFGKPTFFFELIQRQTCQSGCEIQWAQGFGEGNFQALFEAIEREQLKRGRL